MRILSPYICCVGMLALVSACSPSPGGVPPDFGGDVGLDGPSDPGLYGNGAYEGGPYDGGSYIAPEFGWNPYGPY